MMDKNERESTDRLCNSKENEEHKEENGKSFSRLLVNATGIVGPLAMLVERTEFINIAPWLTIICILYTVVIIIMQVIDWIGLSRVKRRVHWIKVIVKNFIKMYWKILVAGSTALILLGVIFCVFFHTSSCYREVTEIYGLPQGVGNALSGKERMQLAGYWMIIDYPFKHQMTLSYILISRKFYTQVVIDSRLKY